MFTNRFSPEPNTRQKNLAGAWVKENQENFEINQSWKKGKKIKSTNQQ
jgi:hypothetical protein